MMNFLRSPSRLWRENRANVSVITALCAVPMFAMLGFAMDYGVALSNKSKLDNAADEAALVAIKTVQTVMQGGGTFAQGQAQGIAQAQMAFAAGAGRLGFANTPSINPTITQSGQKITANVTYATSMTTNFSKLIGISTIPVGGSSTASLALTTYLRIYILVDVSQSMGVGTDQTNMQALYNRVLAHNAGTDGDHGCAFGCHVVALYTTMGGTASDTNENYAHLSQYGPRLTLRIDSAVSAIQTIIAQAQSAANGQANIQIGLYALSLNPTSSTSYINTVSPPSTNYAALSASAATIDLGANSSAAGFGDTTYTTSLTDFNNTILSAQGNGTSASSPLNYVYLITDGVDDVTGPCTDTHCTGPLNPSLCTPIKNNATLGVIYTTYLPICAEQYVNNTWTYVASCTSQYEPTYAALVQPFASQIAPNLQSCATSSAYYFQASDGATLSTDLQQLFASTIQVAHLTQ